MNKALAVSERDELRREADQVVTWAQGAVQIFKQMHQAKPEFYNRFGEFDANLMGLVNEAGALDLYHGGLRATDANGQILFDHVDGARYEEFIEERAKPWTYMKFPHLRALGDEHGWYRVGPLARMAAASHLSTPLANAERSELMAVGHGRPPHGTLLYHWARLIELLHCAELIQGSLDDPEITGTDILADFGPRQREAVGVIEAPRGTLFHHYRVDDNDLVSYCNLIVATTNNNQAMNEAIRHVAKTYLNGREVTEGLLNHIEVAIRAYDPCLSCATHALGQMPLEVDLVGADGALLHRGRRNMQACA
jgi:NAD-reducing hydrogenase large subunit